MAYYTVLPLYKSLTDKYNAPTFQVESHDSKSAMEAAKKSSLGRFEEWSFHVIQTDKIQRNFLNKKQNSKLDSKSKSQRGKKITGHDNSRPVRRALKRLSIARGSSDKNCKIAGAMKMW